jgi:hypothetical protein
MFAADFQVVSHSSTLRERKETETMNSKVWIRVALLLSALLVLGAGYAMASQKKKSVDRRVAELEAKVTTLEHELRIVKFELARTPRLGLQDAK